MTDKVSIRPPDESDGTEFLKAMRDNIKYHHPWTSAPLNLDEYNNFLAKSKSDRNKSFLIIYDNNIAGVININEIILGAFKSAFLGYYGVKKFSNIGVMSNGMKLVIDYAFDTLGLHRIEANIQPDNTKSINLVKRLNFTKEGFSPKYLFIDGKWCDHERWAITIEDWRKE